MKLVLPYAQNVRELLRIEEQYGDPYLSRVNPLYRNLRVPCSLLNNIVAIEVRYDVFDQRISARNRVLKREVFGLILFMILVLIYGLVLDAASKSP